MATNLQALKEAPIIDIDTIDSTNNYAMVLIDADTAQPGLTIIAQEQTNGKGQRGRLWKDIPGQSILMSVITAPALGLEHQFVFSATVAVAIAEVLQDLNEHWNVRIKWPNDIIINDKKTVGILIENVLRGSKWLYAVIGLGVNVLQESFDAALPNAGSLKTASGKTYNVGQLARQIRDNILTLTSAELPNEEVIAKYNKLLYKIHEHQAFTNEDSEWKATILQTLSNGQLQVQHEDGSIVAYIHGSVTWKW
ncbi:biotin--[acetyl-CoA-carboxylase] ligase [Taibaiella soli]|uniref:Biotin--[acetyl-CoA-carboxylase] ligase n=1 Tax=Taibaiella soli TaxID=1649169 RepID=A0A2W2BFZ1_9BACT|nr:biotin--[acetyl-CoA-carboxylase] ligase [Taibaiella soli]PZF72386.1 biotin--[acetyl-CoA-carboxylase] ligase [Taibaiella soli]